jgi:hypothetical protein
VCSSPLAEAVLLLEQQDSRVLRFLIHLE